MRLERLVHYYIRILAHIWVPIRECFNFLVGVSRVSLFVSTALSNPCLLLILSGEIVVSLFFVYFPRNFIASQEFGFLDILETMIKQVTNISCASILSG